jgi:methyl-accepting chemotaxis protein
MASNTASLFGTIRNRLLFGTTALATVPLVALALTLAYFATEQSAESLKARANEQLQSIRVGKEEELKAYFKGVADNMTVVARTTEVRRALTDLPAALQALPGGLPVPIEQARATVEQYYRNQFGAEYARRNAGASVDLGAMLRAQPDATIAAQYYYIATNPHPLGQKGALDGAEGELSAFTSGHRAIHPFGRNVVERYGLYDFFLVDMDGNVVYTYFKELDYASNLKTGPWAKSGLAEAFVAAASGLESGTVRMTDYAPYVPSYEDQATFASTPVFDGDRQIGVFIVQLPIDRVNAIMTFDGKWKDVGLGASGEVYLVGADNAPRSISRFIKEDPTGFTTMMKALGTPAADVARMATRASNIGLMKIDTVGTREVFAGRSGVGVYPDYRGIPVLGAYAPLQVLNQRFAIMSEIDEAEANAPVLALRNQIVTVAGIALALMAVIAIFIALRLARSINQPLAHFTSVVDRVAAGDNVARVKLPAKDEIGQLGAAFDHMLDERIAVQNRISKENEQLNNSVVEIMTSVAELAGRNLDVKVPVAEDVTGAVSDAINMMTRSTATALGRVRVISNAVSAASSSVSQRSQQVHDVASAASNQATAASAELQQTAMALREMGQQATDANQHAERAIRTTGGALEIVRATVSGISESRDQIRETEKRVKRLGERSQEITSVVNIIGQIAERTSVLALNASMQAVAAGDAGRGFAVVADEVKRLAENARQATQQISSLVNAIQADTGETIQAMNGTIAQVVEISKLADQAGGQMNDTRVATEQLASAVRSIASSTQAQSQASATLLNRAYQLLQSSQRTLEELEAQRRDTESLSTSARELVNTVGEFRLPA